ncbi:MAG: hypothetical protein E6Q97_05060 [Desulfurellales bacterium]|nr:MAG: hypothetical protein E6Q97_05060 [Desulfurellales bacterium]
MRIVLFVLAAAGLLFGVFLIANAQTIVHEVEGLIVMTAGVVALGAAAIVEAVNALAKKGKHD